MFSELRGEPVADRPPRRRHDHGRHRTVCRRNRRLLVDVAVRRPGRRRCGAGTRRSTCAAGCGRPDAVTATAGRGRAIAVPAAIAAAILAMWFTPPPQGLTVQAWRLFAIFAGAIVLGRGQRAADSDRVGLRRGRRGADRPAPSGEGVCRLCQRHDSPHRAGVSGGAIGGEVRARRARLAICSSAVSADRRWACRTASSWWTALIAPAFPSNTARSGVHLSARVFAGRCGRREARRRRAASGSAAS